MSGHGGARSNSGPRLDPNSARSEARGIKFVRLPPEGWKGRAPRFPLAGQTEREKVVWRDLWKLPQAKMWHAEKLWRLRFVGLYTRWSVRAEAGDCTAAIVGQVTRLADQLGLTPAGMRENGWKVGAATPIGSGEPDPVPTRIIPPRRPLVMIDGGS
ncbi:MAG: hypothetical protein WBF79_14890 [Rhodococcus sp. (in: high G+C Gram-positive bacteria)]